MKRIEAAGGEMSGISPTPKSPTTGRVPGWVWPVVIAGIVLVVALVLVTVAALMPTPSQTTPAVQSQTKPPQQQSQPEPQPTTVEPAPTVEPPPPLIIPSCAVLNPVAQERTDKFVNGYPYGGIIHGDVGTSSFSQLFGPAAVTAFGQSTQAIGCAYPIHLEAGMEFFAAELAEAPRAALIAALRADGDFVETQHGNALVFTWKREVVNGHSAAIYFVHTFLDNAWIASVGPYEPQVYALPAIDGMRAANPQL